MGGSGSLELGRLRRQLTTANFSKSEIMWLWNCSRSQVCFVVLCFVLCQNSSCGIIDSEVEVDQTTTSISQSAAATVTVELYYESFCPGCRAFITTSLKHAWKTLRKT